MAGAYGLQDVREALGRVAAALAGTIRAPIASFMLLFEMTHGYRIILPLIAAVNVSTIQYIPWD